ncbi:MULTISPECIES: hypothetical protein [Bacillus]|uniref:Uncharacterized protein n=1 Tax=Bacillus pumilus TaxID=1408 RepID=A0AAE3WP93_BACPU|nr:MULTISPECIES: hypothetical protein [Bacillus]MDF9460297.1 hypothetical protein [Bacillus pumilus]MDR4251056.1 hypothetical protein [Bacillus pumilus]PAC81646.1 hypothetical protein CHI05_09515 [Bacillus sp. 7788]PRS41479.1 hypothetical protein C6Y01_13655 [Bacillus sp. NMCC46]QNP16311.1 hypothetical protein H9S87_17630 [Bacillus pumilus]
MDQLSLSIEELIFSFYSEGYFEQGMSLKEAYYPDVEDERLGFLFEIACRSLLAKGVLEFRNRQYRYKGEYRHFIQAMNDASHTVKASRFGDVDEEVSTSFHTTQTGVYAHHTLYDQQVHQIQKLKDDQQAEEQVTAFFNIQMSDHPAPVITLQAEEFEMLLEQASEAKNEWPSFLHRAENEELVQAFVSDVKTRKGKMDSLMKVVYDKNNTPDVESMLFVIPGEEQSWLVSGIKENEFRIETAHRDGLRSIF